MLEKLVAASLGKIGHTPGHQVAWCSIRKMSQVQCQVGLIEITGLGCERRRRAAGGMFHLLQRFLKPDNTTKALWTIANPDAHQAIQMTRADATTGGDFGNAYAPVRLLNFFHGFGDHDMHVGGRKALGKKGLKDIDVLKGSAGERFLAGECMKGCGSAQPYMTTHDGMRRNPAHEKCHAWAEPHANEHRP